MADYFFCLLFCVRLRIFHSYRDIAIACGGLQIQTMGGSLLCQRLKWHETYVYRVSFERPVTITSIIKRLMKVLSLRSISLRDARIEPGTYPSKQWTMELYNGCILWKTFRKQQTIIFELHLVMHTGYKYPWR